MLFSRQLFSFASILAYFGSAYCHSVFAEQIQQEPASSQFQCFLPTYEPIADEALKVTDDSIRITSQYASIEKDQIANFSGDVMLIDKSQTITADNLSFDRLLMRFNAQGNIQYQSQTIDIFASELSANKQDQNSTMLDASYQLHGNPGHGSAGKLKLDSSEGLSLMSSTFTTCPGEDPDWLIKASEITISADGSEGRAYHAQVRLFDVPVLYLPYFSFPVSKQRKTGFLYPKIGSSSNSGLEIEVPFYWNIAPELDATITPHYMSKRGTQLKTEFRYLAGQQNGNIDIEYLHKDNEITSNNDARYLARLQHVGTFSENFRAYVDYTTISDDNYLVDIGSRQYNSNDAYLYQIAELAYFGEQWQTTMKLQDFEVLGDHQASYRTLPHIEISTQQPLGLLVHQDLPGQFELYSELSSFQPDTNTQVSANRYHVEAGLSFPVSTPAWFFNSEFKLMHTYYQQDDIQEGSELTKTVNRTLPKVRFHGGINFDRNMALFGNQYRHTLEPQLQYLYIPEKDQTNIGLYDTTGLQDDYNGLFRDRNYSGLDRVAGANQYTWGVTSRILDQSNLELFRVSLGRIQYIDDNKTFDEFIDPQALNDATEQKSSVAADLFYRLNHQWQISADIQYNTIDDFTNKGQMALNYQIDKYNSLQLNHRYTRNVSGNSLEQASLLANFAINKNWAFVGRFTEDIKNNRSLESYAGFQYESCCWAVRVAYHRHINSNLSDDGMFNENRDEFNSGFVLEFMFKGLNGKQDAIGTQKMFNTSIFGYKRPYYLQN
ncbi:MAG: LPS assembly protein LptD [Colwellia sp.]|nr:LPS assembly protein LptD [Colwellia sp.]